MTIVDYGMGNLRSVQKAFERVGTPAIVASSARDIAAAEALVLPGVGAFRDAIAELKRQDLVAPILDHIAADKPFLGICLGLQLLFETSDEDGEYAGLGVLPGRVVRFDDGQTLSDGTARKIPHMGWNTLDRSGDSSLWQGIPLDAHFYFVHSYHVVPTQAAVVAARTDYGGRFVSAVARGNLFATQFHPEKSQANGLRLLENFAARCGVTAGERAAV